MGLKNMLLIEDRKYDKNDKVIISHGDINEEIKLTILDGQNKAEEYLLKKWDFGTHFMIRIINMSNNKNYGLRYNCCVSKLESKSWADKYVAQQKLIETLIKKVSGK
ncbi:MAG: hypothetical protein ACRCRT_01215 [Cetobacterium somerae]